MEQIKLLTELDYINASNILGVPVAAIKAVAEVESRGNGFFSNGKPKILFEAHLFGKYTKYKYNQSYPNISSKRWDRSLYYGGIREYERLNLAVTLDEVSALKSTSWGKFQIMGFNYKICNYSDVISFVMDQYVSEGVHLMNFVNFIQGNKLDKYIKKQDWAGFAYRYNGPGYKQNHYDTKMEKAFIKHGGIASR